MGVPFSLIQMNNMEITHIQGTSLENFIGMLAMIVNLFLLKPKFSGIKLGFQEINCLYSIIVMKLAVNLLLQALWMLIVFEIVEIQNNYKYY